MRIVPLLLLSAALVLATTAEAQRPDSLPVGPPVRIRTLDYLDWREGIITRQTPDSFDIRLDSGAAPLGIARWSVKQMLVWRDPPPLWKRASFGAVMGAVLGASVLILDLGKCGALAGVGVGCGRADYHTRFILPFAVGTAALISVIPWSHWRSP